MPGEHANLQIKSYAKLASKSSYGGYAQTLQTLDLRSVLHYF